MLIAEMGFLSKTMWLSFNSTNAYQKFSSHNNRGLLQIPLCFKQACALQTPQLCPNLIVRTFTELIMQNVCAVYVEPSLLMG